jgi:hypothetical protein
VKIFNHMLDKHKVVMNGPFLDKCCNAEPLEFGSALLSFCTFPRSDRARRDEFPVPIDRRSIALLCLLGSHRRRSCCARGCSIGGSMLPAAWRCVFRRPRCFASIRALTNNHGRQERRVVTQRQQQGMDRTSLSLID